MRVRSGELVLQAGEVHVMCFKRAVRMEVGRAPAGAPHHGCGSAR
jgi:hypothetical protein